MILANFCKTEKDNKIRAFKLSTVFLILILLLFIYFFLGGEGRGGGQNRPLCNRNTFESEEILKLKNFPAE